MTAVRTRAGYLAASRPPSRSGWMPRVSRSRGAGVLALGSAVSGVLAYVFFAQVTRALGSDTAAPVAVLWTYWSFAGAALTFPLQHWIVRTVTAADGREGSVRHAMRTIPFVALTAAVLTGLLAW